MHYCVYVIHKEEDYVDDILAPFDENLELDEPVIAYTKEEAIKVVRERIEEYKNTYYKEYLDNVEKYEKEHANSPAHIKYLKYEFPKKLNWTDEECYNEMKEDYENNVDEDGNILTERNPNFRWDWYEKGGRWNGQIPNNEVIVKDIDADTIDTPYAFVTLDGEWIERDCKKENDEEFVKNFRDYIKSLDKNILITLVDCHC